MANVLKINPSLERNKLTAFIKTVLSKQGFENIVTGMSGGLDSTTSFYLLKETIPPENIFVAHLYHINSHFKDIEPMLRQARIPKENIYNRSISSLVNAFEKELLVQPNEILNQVQDDIEKCVLEILWQELE